MSQVSDRLSRIPPISAILEDERIARWQFVDERPEDEAIRERGREDPGNQGASSDPRAGSHEGHRRQFQDMVDAVREGRATAIPGDEGRRAVQLITAIYQSARTGKPCPIAEKG